jgi:hypothetical protein
MVALNVKYLQREVIGWTFQITTNNSRNIYKDDHLPRRKNMRYRTIIVVLLFLAITSHETSAQSPPLKSLEIKGKTDEKFNHVSLFRSGKDIRPYKTSYVNSGWYYLKIQIPQDMQDKGKYYITDMRFWGDTNDNGEVDSGESRSQCHFIIWDKKSNKIIMQVYGGPEYEITEATFKYDYE